MERTYDPDILRVALRRYEDNLNVQPELWLLHDGNVALRDGEDVGMFDELSEGIYSGHYFFKSRGKDAYDTAVRMLRWIFEEKAEAIRGLTPVDHKGALFLTRRLGFKDYGEVAIDGKNYVIFVMTRAEFKEKHNG